MEQLFIFAPFVATVGILAFGAGRTTVKFPSEDEMIRRLVDARVERKMRALTKEDVDREIEQTSDRIVAHSR